MNIIVVYLRVYKKKTKAKKHQILLMVDSWKNKSMYFNKGFKSD